MMGVVAVVVAVVDVGDVVDDGMTWAVVVVVA